MSDPFLGQIMVVGFNYAPAGWLPCDGRLLQIQQYTALYSLLGTQFGGNGTTNFALPNLMSRTIVGAGQGSGLSNYPIGTQTGTESVTLTVSQMPTHNHFINADATPGSATTPAANNFAEVNTGTARQPIVAPSFSSGALANPATLAPSTIGPQGGGQGHSNIQPSLAMLYIIAVEGIYPSRP